MSALKWQSFLLKAGLVSKLFERIEKTFFKEHDHSSSRGVYCGTSSMGPPFDPKQRGLPDFERAGA